MRAAVEAAVVGEAVAAGSMVRFAAAAVVMGPARGWAAATGAMTVVARSRAKVQSREAAPLPVRPLASPTRSAEAKAASAVGVAPAVVALVVAVVAVVAAVVAVVAAVAEAVAGEVAEAAVAGEVAEAAARTPGRLVQPATEL